MILYKLNKKNVIMGFVIGLVSIFAGIVLILYPEALSKYGLIRNPVILKLIGIIAVGVMSLFSISSFFQLFNNYGLKIIEKGFVNNTNLMNVGIIYWDDIKSMKLKGFKKNDIIIIHIKDEKKYYDRIKNPLKKINVLTYKKTYGASFVIEPKNIGCTAEELVTVLNKYKNQYLNSKQIGK